MQIYLLLLILLSKLCYNQSVALFWRGHSFMRFTRSQNQQLNLVIWHRKFRKKRIVNPLQAPVGVLNVKIGSPYPPLRISSFHVLLPLRKVFVKGWFCRLWKHGSRLSLRGVIQCLYMMIAFRGDYCKVQHLQHSQDTPSMASAALNIGVSPFMRGFGFQRRHVCSAL